MKKILFLCIAVLSFLGSRLSAIEFDSYFEKVDTSAAWLTEKTGRTPELLFVLTAGVDGPLEQLENTIEISSSEIPYFPTSRAKGHEGKVIFGTFHGKEVAILKGRYHYYEGISAQEVVFPYFVLNKMGVHSVITTNATGGIRYDLNAGDIMCISDHINSLGDNALRGIAIQKPDKQFTDLTAPYAYRDIAFAQAQNLGLDLKEGVYLAIAGPNYETRSEIKMFRTWGADAIGMSTVFEVIACNFLEMKVLAFCCIANPAADHHEGKLSHEEVLEALLAAGPKLSSLVTSCAKQILQVE